MVRSDFEHSRQRLAADKSRTKDKNTAEYTECGRRTHIAQLACQRL
jgi:hypothetical protein